MPLTLLGQYDSPFTRRVAISLRLYGMTFERRVLSTFGDFDAVRQINPLGKVPALVLEDGETLFDSTTILDALEDLAPAGAARLTPSGGAERRTVLRTCVVALTLCEKVMELRGETVRRPPEAHVPATIARIEAQITAALEWLETAAPSGVDGWMHGGRMTQADVTTAVAWTNAAVKVPALADTSRYPRLRAFATRLEETEAFRAAPIDK